MKVHEYQAKAFFADYGVPVDRNTVCSTPDEAVEAYKKLGVDLSLIHISLPSSFLFCSALISVCSLISSFKRLTFSSSGTLSGKCLAA